jgi:hypothetical protein
MANAVSSTRTVARAVDRRTGAGAAADRQAATRPV